MAYISYDEGNSKPWVIRESAREIGRKAEYSEAEQVCRDILRKRMAPEIIQRGDKWMVYANHFPVSTCDTESEARVAAAEYSRSIGKWQIRGISEIVREYDLPELVGDKFESLLSDRRIIGCANVAEQGGYPVLAANRGNYAYYAILDEGWQLPEGWQPLPGSAGEV